ncbi:MAG: adenosylcobinamide-GDP ribazoletransferase [Spirochaetes bacterium]|nr:adenosylcobinamide-GDP ribazoletransferase [Spirochaetota bacterium]
MIKGFLLQLQFLTRIPVPSKIKFEERAFARGIVFAPVIGLIIGLVMAGIYYAVFYLTSKQLPALILAVIFEILITGGLHLDGLADTFDAIFSNRSRERIIEIMKDSRIGTTGALALIMVIISKPGLLVSFDSSSILKCLLIMPVVSRMNIVWAAGITSYAKKDGLGLGIVKTTGMKEVIIASVIAVGVSVYFLKFAALAVFPAAVLFVFLFVSYVKKKIGGITGDIIGAVIELTEIVVLFTLLFFEAGIKLL